MDGRPVPLWPGCAAAVWAFAFAAASLYWAAGGTLLADTVGSDLRNLALERDPAFVALLWMTGGLKVVGGLLGLALAGFGSRRLPRLSLLILGWAGGALLAVYGGVPLIVNALQFGGVVRAGGPVDWTALRWHLLVWDLWWLLGGILFLLAAWSFTTRTRGASRAAGPGTPL